MAMMREKQVRLFGFELTAAVEADQADRLRQSLLWRGLVRPALHSVEWLGGRRAGGPAMNGQTAPATNGAAHPALPGPGITASLADSETNALWEQVSNLTWYHVLDLGHGVVTPGVVDYRAQTHLHGLPADLTGYRCLDIGTYDGFWAFELERRGAAEVVALDLDTLADMDLPRRTRQRLIDDAVKLHGSVAVGDGFRLARQVLGSKVRREVLNVYQLTPEHLGQFDIVFISDVVVHLRDPQTVFENIFSVTRGAAYIASAIDSRLDQYASPLSEYGGTDYSWVWWKHSSKTLKKMLTVAGFEPVTEISRFEAGNFLGRFCKVVLKGEAPKT